MRTLGLTVTLITLSAGPLAAHMRGPHDLGRINTPDREVLLQAHDQYGWGRVRDDRRRAIPRPYPGPGDRRSRIPGRDRWYGYPDVAFEYGYADGFEKGSEDAWDRDRYDPTRHRRYRSATHGYEREYGPKEIYKREYREAFARGYTEGYRMNARWAGRGRDRVRRGWPF
jgi:hypothetical protein